MPKLFNFVHCVTFEWKKEFKCTEFLSCIYIGLNALNLMNKVRAKNFGL